MRRSGRATGAKLAIEMTDRDPLVRFVQIFGLNPPTPKRRRKPHWQDQWIIGTYDIQHITHICGLMWPWLSKRRRRRITEVLCEVIANQKERRQVRTCGFCEERFVPTSRFPTRRVFCSYKCAAADRDQRWHEIRKLERRKARAA
jgi:hypothetical protein